MPCHGHGHQELINNIYDARVLINTYVLKLCQCESAIHTTLHESENTLKNHFSDVLMLWYPSSYCITYCHLIFFPTYGPGRKHRIHRKHVEGGYFWFPW